MQTNYTILQLRLPNGQSLKGAFFVCGESTVQPFLGNNFLDHGGGKIYIHTFSVVSIWKFEEEENNVGS